MKLSSKEFFFSCNNLLSNVTDGKNDNMTNNVSSKTRDWTKSVNKILYTGFLLIAVFYLLFSKNIPEAVSSLGIALIFDPFNPNQPWSQRPLYQRIWLFVHVSIVLLGFVYISIR
jgi:hypothetical protein